METPDLLVALTTTLIAGVVAAPPVPLGEDEAGQSPQDICSGQIVRLVRNGRVHAVGDPAFQSLRTGDRVLEIIDSA